MVDEALAIDGGMTMSDDTSDTLEDRDWRNVRRQIGLTRAGLSAKLGCQIETVRRWEVGESEPALAYQRRMQELLDEPEPDACDCLGCTNDADVVIDHPEKGERTVCDTHATGYEVVRHV